MEDDLAYGGLSYTYILVAHNLSRPTIFFFWKLSKKTLHKVSTTAWINRIVTFKTACLACLGGIIGHFIMIDLHPLSSYISDMWRFFDSSFSLIRISLNQLLNLQ